MVRPVHTRREAVMSQAEHRTFTTPDEVRTFEKGRMEMVEIAGGHVGRLVLEPGRADRLARRQQLRPGLAEDAVAAPGDREAGAGPSARAAREAGPARGAAHLRRQGEARTVGQGGGIAGLRDAEGGDV